MTGIAERGFDIAVDGNFGLTIATRPIDRLCICCLGQGCDQGQGRAMHYVEPGARLFEGGGEGGERMMQPPSRGASQGSKARALIIEDIDTDEGAGAVACSLQGRMIGKAQIVTKPDDGRSGSD